MLIKEGRYPPKAGEERGVLRRLIKMLRDLGGAKTT